MSSPARCLLYTSDAAEVRTYLQQVYDARLKLDVVGEKPTGHRWLSHVHDGADSFAMQTISQTGDIQTRADTTSGAVVLWTLSGRVQSRTGAITGEARTGQVIIAAPGAAPVSVRTHNAKFRTAVIDCTLLAKVAADTSVISPDLVRFVGAEPINAAAARGWMRVHTYVGDTVMRDHHLATPLVLSAAGRLLAAAALTSFPSTARTQESTHDRTDHHPALLRRAIGYIEAHVAEDIGIAEISNAVNVSPRAVQYMFRRHLGLTPTQYLRRVRLDAAHHDLVKADPTRSTVAGIAAGWGFAHASRFAALYRAMYGRDPHLTLRDR